MADFFTRARKNYLPEKNDNKKQKTSKVLFLVSIIVLVIALGMLAFYYYDSYNSKKLNDDLRDLYYSSSILDDSSVADDSSEEVEKPKDPVMLDKFVPIYEKNPDVIGWINIPGTTVDYPVMQTDDNDYYLRRDFEGNYSINGSVFQDYRVPYTADGFADKTVVYGHRTDTDDFFSQLLFYKKLDFVKEHPVITYDTLYSEQKYVIVAGFLTGIRADQDGGVLFDYHNNLIFDTEDEFNYFYDNVRMRSYFNTSIDVEYGDEFLVLSTCSREFANCRWVTVAIKLEEGESIEIPPETYSNNPDTYMPLVWYQVTDKEPPR